MPTTTSLTFVTKTKLPALADYVRLLEGVWDNHQVTNNGPLVRQLEDELARYLGVPHLVLVANGTVAIQLALRDAGLTEGVITTPYSYVATTNALLWEGLRPVFADVDPTTLCLDPQRVAEAITPRVSGILATHVYGFPCDHERLRALAEEHNLKVIYDAAHAFGVRDDGGSILQYGDYATLSFHATKVYHTVEGGAVVTADAEAAERLRLLRSFGHVGEDYRQIGINAKMSELHAGVGLLNLRTVGDQLQQRAALFDHYRTALAPLGDRLRLLEPQDAALHWNHAYCPVLFRTGADRDRAEAALRAVGIIVRRYFGQPLNRLPHVTAASCPVAESACRRVLCLPFYPDLPAGTVDRIAGVLRSEPLAA